MIMQPAINTAFRLSNALLVASAVTFGLLCLMNFLIETDLVEPEVDNRVIIHDFIQEKIDIIEIEKPPKEKINEPTPPPRLPRNETITEHTTTGVDFTPYVQGSGGVDVEIFNIQDGGHIRLVAAAPNYPQRALERGIEGYVDIRFDILKNGTTANIEILASQPSSIFDSSVLKAVARWKYQPQMEGGKPMDVLGVMERVSFELEK